MSNVTWTDGPRSLTWGGWAAPVPRVCPRPSSCVPGCQLIIPGHSHSQLTEVIVMPSCLQLTGPLRRQHSVSAVASVRTALATPCEPCSHPSLTLSKGYCPEATHNITPVTTILCDLEHLTNTSHHDVVVLDISEDWERDSEGDTITLTHKQQTSQLIWGAWLWIYFLHVIMVIRTLYQYVHIMWPGSRI